MSYLESTLKTFLQQPYQDSKAFLHNVIFPVFGEENFESAGNLNVLSKRPDLMAKANVSGILEIRNVGTLFVEGSELDIFDITIDYKKQLQRNRVEIQQIIRSILSSHSGAFILFHYQSGARWEWRFTFCHKGASNDDSTDAKRYTFLLGPGQSCRTAADNFAKIHEKIEKEGTFEMQDIIEAFDVEALSKEFFGKYKAHYETFCNYVYENKNNLTCFGHEFAVWSDKTIRDYVKKLLGRIVFLHFLQKKGWLGVPADQPWGEGDRQFMKNLYQQASPSQQANYLDEVLEPLFQKALDTDRKSSGNLFDTGVQGFRSVKIPYLNGGLFERDILDEPLSVFPSDYFKDLFEFLSEYNFTIDENDPNDAEVGVDPEMLGRIFENLLEDNKDKGAFYTPKEIVQYMCRESLIAYLTTSSIEGGNQNPREKIEAAIRQLLQKPEEIAPRMNDTQKENFGEALRKVRICDPAIGSGAFPMGLLNELVRCRVSIDAWAKAEDGQKLTGDYAALKREIICNNIYGVDIERGAIDIARLRFWLSIVVDEQEPQILPNLDYKFMEGNSLITTFDSNYIDLTSQSVDKNHAEKIRKEKLSLYQLKKNYYTASGDEKMRLAVDIKDSILRIVAVQLGFESRNWLRSNVQQFELGFEGDAESMSFDDIKKCLPKEKLIAIELAESLHRQLKDETIPLKQRAQLDIHFFNWRIMFTEVFDCENPGFDIVIGNPPYIQLQKDGGCLADLYKPCKFKTFDRMGDIYCLFYEHGYYLLRDGGALCYITSNKWMRTGYGEKTRAFVKDYTNPTLLIDFLKMKLFDDATVETNILLLTKNQYKNSTKCAALVELKKNDLYNLNNLIDTNVYENKFESTDFWTLSDAPTGNLKNKIKKAGTPLKDWNLNIFRGVLTGFNDAFIIPTEKKNELLAACLSEEERKRTEAIMHKIIRGKDVGVYNNNWADLWLIFIPWHFPLDKDDSIVGASSIAEGVLQKEFPALYTHLYQYKEQLSARNKAETGIRYEWYAMQRWGSKYWMHFAEPKIIWKRIGSILRFAYDEEKSMCLDSTCFATGEHVKFLCAIFNSKLGHFMLQDSPKTGTGDLLISVQAIEPIVVPMPSEEQKNDIEFFVDRILSAKGTSYDEQEIDKLVYKLYNLTPEEITIVEGKNE